MIRLVWLGLTCLLVGAVHAEADRPWWQPWFNYGGTTEVATQLFSEDERAIIESYYRETNRYGSLDEGGKGREKPKKAKPLPPGLQKKLERGGELPPGWQKKVARGEVLEGDLYQRSRSLPDDLRERLDPPNGTEDRVIDDQVIRIINDTQLILDVLSVY